VLPTGGELVAQPARERSLDRRSRRGVAAVTRLTYLQFLAVFVAPPLVALVADRAANGDRSRLRFAGVGVLLVLALAWTTPWDNYLVGRGVWTYGSGTVAATLWRAPVEEYLFVAGQTGVAGLWVQRLATSADATFRPTGGHAAVGVLAGALVGAAGVFALQTDATFYLGAILAWAAPVLALQWAVGWRYLLDRPRTLALGVPAPTLYFAIADRVAIAAGVWTLAPEYTTGVAVLGLPVEEGLFFLTTTLFVAQGLVLYDWVVARWG
jgi:lycopene cyclase domain-containing protein